MNILDNNLSANFNNRRVVNSNRTVNIYGLFEDSFSRAENKPINALTQGYNFNGCGVIFKLDNAGKKNASQDLNEQFAGKQVRLNFCFDELNKGDDDMVEATVLRAGTPRTNGYDVFCALQFEFVPTKISMRISKELKNECSN